MATHVADHSKHATLTADVVDSVTLEGGRHKFVEVVNRGTDPIYFTTNEADPTVAGDDTFVVAGGTVRRTESFADPDVVKLISAGATAYSVIGLHG